MFGLNKMTLKRYIDKVNKIGQIVKVEYSSVSLAHSVFTPTIEKDLADHFTNLTDQCHGFSLEKIKELVYEFAIKNKLKILNLWISEIRRERLVDWF